MIVIHIQKRFDPHNHSEYSNTRLLDCINKPEKLVQRAIDIGLAGFCITDHEILSGAIKFNKLQFEIQKEHPDFKIGLGNEIYLTETREKGQKYYHYILIAKDEIGFKQLKILSSRSWMQSYYDRGLERVPTLKSELAEIVKKEPGHLITTTACFRKGTQVLTKTGLKNIENINCHDEVLNMYGQWESVIEPTSRLYQGKGYSISFLENPIPTICTENHKFLVTTNNKIINYKKRGTDPRVWVSAKDLNPIKGGTKHICLFPLTPIEYTNNDIIYKEEWKNSLKKDYFNKISINDKITMTPEVMRLFGLWLGDGSISVNQEKGYYCINFSFSEEEFPYYWESFVKKASEEIGITWSISKKPQNHRVDLTSHSIELVELFYYLFGISHAKDKKIPERLKHINKDCDFNLIFGYLLADGYFRTRVKDNYEYGEMVAASISENLIEGIQDLLKQYGIRSSISIKLERTDKNGVHHQQSYYLSSSNIAWTLATKKSFIKNEDISNIFNKAIQYDAKKHIEINGVTYKKIYIKEKDPIILNEQVYCLNNTTHSFICNNVIVHNCLGGELSSSIVEMEKARKIGDKETETIKYNQIISFLKWNINLFHDDFYVECAPGASKEQIIANKKLLEIAKIFNIKLVIGCDAHYLKKEDRYVHKSYLNSKGGEREVDSFYEYAYMQDEEDIIKNLAPSIANEYEWMCSNSMEIYNKIQIYNLARKQKVPKVPVKNYPKKQVNIEYPTLKYLYNSDDIYDRYWINECELSLKRKGLDKKEYWDELEYEADIKKAIGDGLGTNVFSYPITLQYYIDLIWNCGSPLGAGRGSSMAGLNHYLLNVTQIDPVKTGLNFFWRYMNKDRQELPDIDIDLAPEKRPLILQKIKEERGQRFNKDIDELSRKNLGCTLVATFGTESTKSSILTSCRGYRSEAYPDGIDVDTAQYLSSLIPQERGALWSLEDVLYGNPEKNRKPVQPFIQEVEKYPGLLDIMLGIQNLINKRSSHASGVIFFDEDPYDNCCFMKTPKGEIITQWDLHDAEFAGNVKYDFLVTDIESKITTTINLLQKKGLIEQNLSLREVYNKYLHPDILPIDDIETWKNIQKNNILNLFQFDSLSGSQGIKKVQPKNMQELSATNGLIRLTAGEGLELPMDKYVRYKKNLQLWYNEMDRYGLTAEQQENVTPYFKPYYGVPISQEVLMQMVMDKNICGFSLKEANELRKVLAKKQLQKIPQMKEKIINRATTPQLGKYIWEAGAGPQMSYSFSVLHSTAYSYIGFQTAYLATHWNPIYWNTACLIVNSGSLEEETKEEIVSINAPEDDDCLYEDLPDRTGKKKIEKTTDYSKLAKAIGDITSRGIKISLIDINKSEFSFSPDEANNEILFGLKGVNKIGDSIIKQIIENRPYTGIIDFMSRCHLNKTQMIQLIKSGAFDKTDMHWAKDITPENPRYAIMAYYLYNVCEPKTKLNLQNFNGLLNNDLIPESLKLQKQTYLFNKFLKDNKKFEQYYILDSQTLAFYCDHYDVESLSVIKGIPCILQSEWEKIYKKTMDSAREWLKNNQEEVLEQYNFLLFKEAWKKYANNNISAWEMESLCFYHHSHELAGIDNNKYGIVNFFDLSYEPEVDYWYKRNNKQLPIFKLYKIAGTILSKDNTKATISVLTTSGVVTVKFSKEYYAMFNRQISQIQNDGKKKVLEKGWFVRGTKVLITGYRREDTFVAKTYKNTATHQLYKITNVNGKNITLEHERIETDD